LSAVLNAEAGHDLSVFGGIASCLDESSASSLVPRVVDFSPESTGTTASFAPVTSTVPWCANLKSDIDVALFAAAEFDAGSFGRFEAFCLDRQLISSDRTEAKV